MSRPLAVVVFRDLCRMVTSSELVVVLVQMKMFVLNDQDTQTRSNCVLKMLLSSNLPCHGDASMSLYLLANNSPQICSLAACTHRDADVWSVRQVSHCTSGEG